MGAEFGHFGLLLVKVMEVEGGGRELLPCLLEGQTVHQLGVLPEDLLLDSF